jgi:peptidoglycan/xylan/chitin deacetylase (PgdA/CDA1 family)
VSAARLLAVAAGGAAALEWAPAPAALLPRVAERLGIPSMLPSERGVLLTFDDGPHPDGTTAVLAELGRMGAPALFFVSGEQVATQPRLVQEIASAGHEVALHGFRHQTRREWSRRALMDDTLRALDAVFAASGLVPRLYRPPHGVFTLSGLRLIRSLGLEPLLWSKWGRDWARRASPASIARRATMDIRAGDVVLLHDSDCYGTPGSWRRTADALPQIIEHIAFAGLRAASVRKGSRLALVI